MVDANAQGRAHQIALSIDETCYALGVSRSTIYRMLGDDRLRCVHIGRRILIPVTELERLIGPTAGALGPGG